MRKAWTPGEDQTLRRLSKSGLTDGEVATHLPGRDKDSVRYRRLCLGIQTAMSPKLQMMMLRVNARRKGLHLKFRANTE